MRERGLIEADCPTCGDVIAPASALVCGVSEADNRALCELQCPGCGRLLLHRLARDDVITLFLLGARKDDSLPFELLEAHSGPAVSWDEVLDLHFELERQAFPQRELVRGQAA